MPKWAAFVLFIVSIVLGTWTASILPQSLKFFGWIVGGGALIGGAIWLNGLFEKRVEFSRRMRTK
jgi:hypothetical protein